jgi:fibro-slime domain-containing protein
LSAGDDYIVLSGTAYDFSNGNIPGGHPDFNTFGCGVMYGMVEDTLGDDNKPVLNGNGKGCVTSADTFNQWFNEVSGVNIPFPVNLVAYWDEPSKAYKYMGTPFFPLDGQGYGYEGMPHNYGFCYELHTRFSYVPGQVFEFMGDDDVWVFINRKLAIDLGGVHPAASDSVSLDSLGLTEGYTYPLDFFFCERHQSESNLIFSTSIELDPCGTDDSDNDGIPDLCDPCPKGDMELQCEIDKSIIPFIADPNLVFFRCSLGAPALQPYTITINFGDGTSQDFSVSNDLVTQYRYDSNGDYKVEWMGSKVAGCGEGGSGTIDVSIGGRRLAPKCSEFEVVPGAPAKRKRSV